MAFTHPYFLILLLLIPFGWYLSRNARDYFSAQQFYTFNGMRSLVWLLLILALAGLQISWGSFGNISLLWVVDSSASISARQRKWFKDYLLRVTDALPSGGKAGVVLCGREAKTILDAVEPDQLKELYDKPLKDLPDPGFSNLAGGVEAALSLAPVGYASRLVLLSDGNENFGELTKAAQLAASQGVPIYPVIPPQKEIKEIAIESFTTPDEVQKGEAFEIKVHINNLNLESKKARLKLFSGDKQVASKKMTLVPGINVQHWNQRLKTVGSHFYKVELIAVDDTSKENNYAMGAVTVKGAPRVLCVEGKGGASQFLAKVLKDNGMEVIVKKRSQIPKDITDLASYSALVFNNIPRTALTIDQMKMIKSYVSDFGGGFMMLGGEESFSSGGYYKTPIEEILPVNMDQNVSYKFKQVLLMILMDRSLSMEGRKIDLAKTAAIKVLDQLRDSDMIGLTLFDSTFDRVLNFQMIWGQRAKMAEAINGIKTGKGGTNIYPALEDAYNQLLNPPSSMRQLPLQIKHILLLTDGKTYRAEFEKLAAKIAHKGMSISTIAVGPEAEVELLGNIARIGRGLFHHPDKWEKLPELFVSDLQNAISKTPFVEKKFDPKIVAESPILTGIDPRKLPPLKGYMVTKPKPGAQLVLVSPVRGFNDPILAHWRYGLGTTIAYTSDVIPRWSSKWIGWSSFSKFWVQAVRFMVRMEKSDWKVEVQRIPEGAMISLDTGKDKAQNKQLSAYLVSLKGEKIEVPLDRIGWGKYRGRVKTNLFGKFVLNIREKEGKQYSHRLSRGIVIPRFLDEYRQFGANEQLLRRIAQLSGGEFNPQTTQPLLATTSDTAPYVPIWQYLVGIALILFVSEVALRKWWL